MQTGKEVDLGELVLNTQEDRLNLRIDTHEKSYHFRM